MKRIYFLLTVFLLTAAMAKAQHTYTPLADALKNATATEAVTISPFEKGDLKKFIRHAAKFEDLAAVYIQRGFDNEQLAKLVAVLQDFDLEEVVIECDTLSTLVAQMARLEGTDKITFVEPFTLPKKALLDVVKLKSPSICFNSSTEIIIPEGFAFPESVEEIGILAKNTENISALTDKLTGLEKLTSILISTDTISNLPKAVGQIESLRNLEIITTKDLDRREDIKYSQVVRVAREGKECKRLVNITYNTDVMLEDHELNAFSNAFEGFYLLISDVDEIPNTGASNAVFPIDRAYNPLVENITVPRRNFRVTAENQSEIRCAGGTVIQIPQNAFVYPNGVPATGTVDISYREIKTPLEMLAAGVNMAYDSAGVTYQFESAGNFELLASQNGKPLELGKGKEVTVNFMSASEGDFNLYKYDEEKQNWVYDTKANELAKPVAQEPKSANKITPELITEIDSALLKSILDFTPYGQRFASPNHRYMLDSGDVRGNLLEEKRGRHRRSRVFYLNSRVSTSSSLIRIKIVDNKNIKSDSLHQVAFKIIPKEKFTKKNRRSLYDYFPEFSALGNLTFYTEDEYTRREFRDAFIRRKKYNDVRIEYEPGQTTCNIVLKLDGKFVTLTADLAPGRKGSGPAYKAKSFARRHKRYTKYLANRVKRLDDGLEVKKAQAMYSLYNVRTVDLNRYRVVRMTTLGLTNCDRPIIQYTIPPQKIENLLVKTESGEEITPTIAYVLDKEINGVLTYNPAKVEYRKKTVTKIMAVDKDKNIYCTYLPANQSIQGNTVLMRKTDTGQVKTVTDLGNALALGIEK